MNLKHTITFDYDERDIIRRALCSIRIAYRGWDEEEKCVSSAQFALGCMTAGTEVDARKINTGLLAMEQLILRCEEESDVRFWRGQMAAPGPPHEVITQNEDGTTNVTVGEIPMVLDPDSLAKVLAATREMQLREAKACEELLERAQRALDRLRTASGALLDGLGVEG